MADFLKVLFLGWVVLSVGLQASSRKVQSCRDLVAQQTQKTIDYYEAEGGAAYHKRTESARLDRVYREFLSYVGEPPAHILDAGCGSGRDAKWFKDRGYEVTAYDATPSLVAFASEFAGLDVLTMRFDEMKFKSKFNGVWAMSSLLHAPLADLPKLIESHVQALKVNGVMFLSLLADTDGSEESFSERGPDYSRGRRWLKLSASGLQAILEPISGIEILKIADPQSDSLNRTTSSEGLFWTEAFLRRVPKRR